MSKETGGPAYPLPLGSETVEGQEGMALRDYFAAKAINGILSDPDAGLLEDDLNRYAGIAYRVADAMLKARETQ
ncbi:hypothetical protein [Erwinia phyllosphaerae]|uniref:hypothetical protein n=1 Tax=Erwinia phyllosphaerae TaxID=2853256 RepID=UPI001FF07697|nr:hypothetical protein [Erwinia phyllosphaerae]MBV4365879.1 hypothetical protein [Erwinia phyllosphaerae]